MSEGKRELMKFFAIVGLFAALALQGYESDRLEKRVLAAEKQIGTLQKAVLEMQNREKINVDTANKNTDTLDAHTRPIITITEILKKAF